MVAKLTKKCERPYLEPMFNLSVLGYCRNTVVQLEVQVGAHSKRKSTNRCATTTVMSESQEGQHSVMSFFVFSWYSLVFLMQQYYSHQIIFTLYCWYFHRRIGPEHFLHSCPLDKGLIHQYITIFGCIYHNENALKSVYICHFQTAWKGQIIALSTWKTHKWDRLCGATGDGKEMQTI